MGREVNHRWRGGVWARLLAGLLVGGCSTAQVAKLPPAPEPVPAPAAPESPPPDLRALPPTATYGDLVARIEQLDGLAQEAAREACLLARYTRTGAFELRGELAVAVRPPPPPPVDLDEAVAGTGGFRLLSRFGSVGEGELALVELTATRPTRRVAALVLTDAGTYLLDLRSPPAPQPPTELEALLPALEQLGNQAEPVRLQVLAEADVPLERVDRALVAVKSLGLAVSLASALPPGTALPESLSARQQPTCPEGLPESEAAPGELDLDETRARLAVFSEAARICAHETGGRALAGGKILLAVRVEADGTVGPVCSVSDDIGEPRLQQCLRHAAARLRLPAPGGPVDLHLPVRLAPAALPVPKSVCE